MADDITYSGTGSTVPENTKQATDEHASRGHMPIVKLAYSADGSATLGQVDADGVLVNLGANNDVTVTGSVTANAGTNLNTSALALEATLDARTGALTETAPTTDTASSGLNGRLQRIAQRITSLIALFPTSLGQKTKANSLAVTLASDQDALPITDNSGSLTVDGTVAATQSGTWTVQPGNTANTTAWKVDGSAVTQPVSAASLPLPSGASTSAKQDTQITAEQAIQTAVELIDDIIYTDDTSTHSTGSSKGALIMAAATPTDASVNANDIGAVAMTNDRKLHVSVQDSLPAGTNAIGKLSANSGVDIGDVDVASIAAGDNNIGNVDIASIAAGDNNIGNVDVVTLPNVVIGSGTVTTVTTVSTVTAITGGGVAHDNPDSGNPLKVGARAAATLSNDTMIADADRSDMVADLDGALITRNQFPLGDLISEVVSDTGGTSTAFTNFGATASTRNYVTAVSAFRTDAGTTLAYLDLRDGAGGSVIYRVPLPPAGGAVIGDGNAPLCYTTAGSALAYDVSAGLTTVYINVTGFKSKVRA